MPWHVEETDACPTSRPWGVIRDSNGAVEGCHSTQAAAERQMSALYANEDGDKMTGGSRTKSAKSIKVKTEGEFEVVFATLDVVDHDGDILTKEAFTDGAPVIVSAYGHGSHRGQLPVGKGRIVMTDDEATAVGRFFLDTTHGRDTYNTVKELSDDDSLQEWSFSLRDVEGATGKDKDGNSGFKITKVAVKEISPVLEGAGIDTRTVAIKGRKASVDMIGAALRDAGRERWGGDEIYVWVESWDVDESKAVFAVWADDEPERLVQVSFERDGDTVTLGGDEVEVRRVLDFVPKGRDGARLNEEAKAVVADLGRLTDRAAEVVAMRTAKGKGLSPETVAVIGELDAQMSRLRQLTSPQPSTVTTSETLIVELELLELEAQT